MVKKFIFSFLFLCVTTKSIAQENKKNDVSINFSTLFSLLSENNNQAQHYGILYKRNLTEKFNFRLGIDLILTKDIENNALLTVSPPDLSNGLIFYNYPTPFFVSATDSTITNKYTFEEYKPQLVFKFGAERKWSFNKIDLLFGFDLIAGQNYFEYYSFEQTFEADTFLSQNVGYFYSASQTIPESHRPLNLQQTKENYIGIAPNFTFAINLNNKWSFALGSTMFIVRKNVYKKTISYEFNDSAEGTLSYWDTILTYPLNNISVHFKF